MERGGGIKGRYLRLFSGWRNGTPLHSTMDEGMRLIDLWRIIGRHKLLVATGTFLVVAIVFVLSLLSTPMYRASVVLSPVADNTQSAGLSALASQLGGLAAIAGLAGGGTNRNDALALLRSRAFTTDFIESQNLLPILYPNRWDAKKGAWSVENPSQIPTLQDAYQLFDQQVRFVSEDPQTGLITLSVEWPDREKVAEWANLMVARVNDAIRSRAREEAKRSLLFLNKELESTSTVELRQMIYRLIENETSKIVLANVREEYAFKVIDPAVTPDADHYINPRRGLKMAVGLVVGFFLSVGIAIFIDLLRRDRAANA